MSADIETVYHFTDSARLPYILADGELKPGLNRIGAYPSDFVWATTSDKGSRTASGAGGSASKDAYRKGMTRLVRISFAAELFTSWPDILKDFPEWNDADRERLEQTARDLGDNEISNWRCSPDAVQLSNAIKVETRTYTGRWEPFEIPTPAYTFPDGAVGLKIGKLIYPSKQIFSADGVRGYQVFPPVSPDAVDMIGEAA